MGAKTMTGGLACCVETESRHKKDERGKKKLQMSQALQWLHK